MSFFESLDSFFVDVLPEEAEDLPLAEEELEEEFYSFDPLILFRELTSKDVAIKKRMSFISSNLQLLSNYLKLHADFAYVPAPVEVQETPEQILQKRNHQKFFALMFALSNGVSGKGILI